MPYYPPDTPPPAHGVPQMPAAAGAGTEPVPYAGPDQRPEPPLYSVGAADMRPPGADIMSGVAGAMGVQESGYAHDIASATVAPYYPGTPSAIYAGGNADAGGRDDVSGTITGAVAAAEARYLEHQSDTFSQGGVIGDLMTLPPVPEDANAPAANFLFAEGDQPGKGT